MNLRIAVPAVVLLGAAAYGAVALYGAQQRRIGRLQAQVAVQDSALTALATSKRKVDSVYVVKQDTLRLVRHRTDSIVRLDTLLIHRTDTLTRIRIDTVRQLVEAERNACDAVVRTCEQRVAQRDSIIQFQAAKIRALGKREKLFWFVPKPSRTAAFAAGIIGGYIIR